MSRFFAEMEIAGRVEADRQMALAIALRAAQATPEGFEKYLNALRKRKD